jgi:hypothetical protein
VLGRPGVADDEARPGGVAGHGVPAQAAQRQPALLGPGGGPLLGRRLGKVDDDMQAGRDAAHPEPQCVQGRDQPVAPASVDHPGAAGLPVVGAGDDELRQRASSA